MCVCVCVCVCVYTHINTQNTAKHTRTEEEPQRSADATSRDFISIDMILLHVNVETDRSP